MGKKATINGKLKSLVLRGWAKLIQQKRAYVMGDSHTKVFNYINTHYPHLRYRFDVTTVEGGTAMGMANPKSKTDCLNIFRKKIAEIDDFNTPLIFLLGEVDTGFVIWYRSQKYGTSVKEQLNTSVNNYFNFLYEVKYQGFNNIMVISAPLPTIKDHQDWGEIANLRKVIKATQKERTELTLRYNQTLGLKAGEVGFNFLNLDPFLLDFDLGLIAEKYLNANKSNHHLDNVYYSKAIVKMLKENGLV